MTNKNVTICSQYKQLCKIEKSCIIYVVAAVALQARIGACEELLPERAVRLAPVRALQVLFCYRGEFGRRFFDVK